METNCRTCQYRKLYARESNEKRYVVCKCVLSRVYKDVRDDYVACKDYKPKCKNSITTLNNG